MILLFLSVGLASPLQDCMAWLDGHPATELSRQILSPPEPARRLDRYLDQGNRLLSQAQRRCSEAMRLDPAEVQLWIGDWLYDRGNRLRVLPAFQGADQLPSATEHYWNQAEGFWRASRKAEESPGAGQRLLLLWLEREEQKKPPAEREPVNEASLLRRYQQTQGRVQQQLAYRSICVDQPTKERAELLVNEPSPLLLPELLALEEKLRQAPGCKAPCLEAVEATRADPGAPATLLLDVRLQCRPTSPQQLILEAQALQQAGEGEEAGRLLDVALLWGKETNASWLPMVEGLIQRNPPPPLRPPSFSEQVSPPCVSGTEIPLDPALCAVLAPCTEAFLTLQAQHIEADTLLARRDFDQALLLALREKALLLSKMESTCTQAATTNGPLKTAAWSTLALGYSDMGDAVSTSTRPPYLSPEQRVLYEGALMDKVHPMREKENAAWELAKQAAPELAELLTRQQTRVTIAQKLAEQQQELERLQRSLYSYGRPQPPVHNPGQHLGELKEEHLKMEQLFQEKGACLDPETREMSRMVLEQTAAVIQEKDLPMVADIYDVVVEWRRALEAAPPCAVPAP